MALSRPLGEKLQRERRRQNELRIVLLGGKGAGKSATGNTLKRGIVFTEDSDPQSGTIFTQTENNDQIGGFPEYKLSITDVPGFVNGDHKMVQTQITQFFGQLSPGPHVIVIVVSAGQRVTEDILRQFKAVSEILGDGCARYMMFMFTKVDQITTRSDPEPRPITEWIESLCRQNEEFRAILTKCGNRYVGINNRLRFTSDEFQQQMQNIMNMFVGIVRGNGGTHFTNDQFNMIEENIMRPLDVITGDRSTSRSKLSSYLMGALAVVPFGYAAGVANGAAAIAGNQAVQYSIAKTVTVVGKGFIATSVTKATAGAGLAIAGGAGAGAGGASAPLAITGVAATGGAVAAAAPILGACAVAGVGISAWMLYKSYGREFIEAVKRSISGSDEEEH